MENINRRQFLKKSAIAIAVTSTTLCSLGGCAAITKVGSTTAAKPESITFKDRILTIDLKKEPILSKVGGAVKIKHADIPEGMIIAHVEDNRFEIASLYCSHRGVEVEYQHSQKNFECASLGSSKFSLDGHNISGPADKPLKEYKGALKDGFLIINL